MSTAIDTARIRRENLRWLIILTLNNARPIGAYEGPILSVAQSTGLRTPRHWNCGAGWTTCMTASW